MLIQYVGNKTENCNFETYSFLLPKLPLVPDNLLIIINEKWQFSDIYLEQNLQLF